MIKFRVVCRVARKSKFLILIFITDTVHIEIIKYKLIRIIGYRTFRSSHISLISYKIARK